MQKKINRVEVHHNKKNKDTDRFLQSMQIYTIKLIHYCGIISLLVLFSIQGFLYNQYLNR